MTRRFCRDTIHIKPLSDRVNKLDILRDAVDPATYHVELSDEARSDVESAAREILAAKSRGASRMLAFGAHSIKNGLARVLVRLMDGGWITHFATNGAGVIHDWEFAYQSKSGEDVQRYTGEGQFGIWNETGTYINLAILVGAWRGLGYGESVGTMIADGGLTLPEFSELEGALGEAAAHGASEESVERAAAAADLLGAMKHFDLKAGFMPIPHQLPDESLSCSAYRRGVPFTCHPMFGHDIIYTHPMNHGAAIGRTAQRDFLSFVDSVSRLEGGVYLSVGSAVMSPMIFEKSLSMSRNVALARGENITDFSIHVVDLARSAWDWTHDGEPPQDNPAYYLRFCKTFSRMGGRMTYASADNRCWLVALLQTLEKTDA